MSTALSISLSGIADATLRSANAAHNISNASSAGKVPDANGGTYTGFQPQDVVAVARDTGASNFGVQSTLTPRQPAYNIVSDPTSSLANAQGLVGVPNVDLASELIAAKIAQISYAADAKVLAVTEKTQKTLLDTVV